MRSSASKAVRASKSNDLVTLAPSFAFAAHFPPFRVKRSRFQKHYAATSTLSAACMEGVSISS